MTGDEKVMRIMLQLKKYPKEEICFVFENTLHEQEVDHCPVRSPLLSLYIPHRFYDCLTRGFRAVPDVDV